MNTFSWSSVVIPNKVYCHRYAASATRVSENCTIYTEQGYMNTKTSTGSSDSEEKNEFNKKGIFPFQRILKTDKKRKQRSGFSQENKSSRKNSVNDQTKEEEKKFRLFVHGGISTENSILSDCYFFTFSQDKEAQGDVSKSPISHSKIGRAHV